MKKLILLSTLMVLFLASPIFGQSARYDATEQSKRLARKNNHITKTYKGEVIKMLYTGLNSYGGALNGFIFRRESGKLLQVSLPTGFGSEIAPHLKTKGKIEITVTGDELLLEEIFSKRLSMKKIEVQLQEEISGLANIKGIKTAKGEFSVYKQPNKYSGRLGYTKSEPVLNVKVLKRIRLKGKEGVLELENGDSLIFNRIDGLEDIWNQNIVSYLKPKRNSRLYYQNPHLYSMDPVSYSILYSFIRGRLPKPIPNSPYNPNHSFLKSIDAKFVELISDDAGFVNGLTVENNKNKLDTFWFDRADARAFNTILEKANDENIKLYFNEVSQMNLVYAIELNDQTIVWNDKHFQGFIGSKDEYLPKKMSFKGKVTAIQYLPESAINYRGEKNIIPFNNVIVNDSIFVRLNNVVALSIAKQIETGKEISFDGWQRRELPTQINQKGYSFIIPHKITVDGITFTNNSYISRSQ